MLIFVFAVCSIEFIQKAKTDKALEELNKLSSLNVKVIRNKREITISSDDVVVGDIVILEEGDKVPVDGIILYSQSLGVNESCLTGESVVVYKSKKDDNNNHFKLNMCYSGTDIINGMGVIKIIAVGKNSEFRLKGLLIFIVVFFTYLYLLNNTTDINLATTIAYSTLVLDIMFITYQLKDSKNTILTFIESFKDKVSTIVTSGIILGLLAFIYLPFYNKVANTLPLDIKWWLLIIFLVLISVIPFDILKIKRNKK